MEAFQVERERKEEKDKKMKKTEENRMAHSSLLGARLCHSTCDPCADSLLGATQSCKLWHGMCLDKVMRHGRLICPCPIFRRGFFS